MGSQHDENKASLNQTEVPDVQGPITRARAKKFKEELNLFITKIFKESLSPNEEMKLVNVIEALHGNLGQEEVDPLRLGWLNQMKSK